MAISFKARHKEGVEFYRHFIFNYTDNVNHVELITDNSISRISVWYYQNGTLTNKNYEFESNEHAETVFEAMCKDMNATFVGYGSKPVKEEQKLPSDWEIAAVEYEKKFGKKPVPNMKLETMQAKLEEAK